MSSMIWKECTPRDGWWSRTLRPIHAADVSSLLHLYQPIVGTAAIGLYLTLAYQIPLHRAGASEVHSHLYLMNLLSLPLQDLFSIIHPIPNGRSQGESCHFQPIWSSTSASMPMNCWPLPTEPLHSGEQI